MKINNNNNNNNDQKSILKTNIDSNNNNNKSSNTINKSKLVVENNTIEKSTITTRNAMLKRMNFPKPNYSFLWRTDDHVLWLTCTKSRLGLCVLFMSVSLLLYFGNAQVMRQVGSRAFAGESFTQITFAVLLRSTNAVLTQWHILLTIVYISLLFYLYPIGINVTVVAVVSAVAALPFGTFLVYKGEMTSQLESRMTPKYWTFSFEAQSNSATPDVEHFALSHRGPSTIIGVLTITNILAQMMEIVGMDSSDKAELIHARNHFLYRIRNSGSFRHRAIATELLFRKVSEIILKRTAIKFVSPASDSRSKIESQMFTKHLIERSESIVRPLPYPIDPDSLPKLSIVLVASLLLHKRLFQMIKGTNNGNLNSGLTATKHLSRFVMLCYLCLRYGITIGKNQSSNELNSQYPPRLYR